ncbi:MAG: nucleotidyltransferase domain-containing protein [Candidatus Kariarchaeaceae archaeon]
MSLFDELIQFLINKAIKTFPDKIALIITYGSSVTGGSTVYSDLDILAIVDDSEKFSLYWPFIYQDKAVEFWSMDWSVAKRWAAGYGGIMRPWGLAASLFINSKIVYSRSSEDEEKYNAIVSSALKVKENEQANLNQAMNVLNRTYSFVPRIKLAKEKNDLIYGRWVCCGLTDEVKNTLSWLNCQYYTGTSEKSIYEMMNFDLTIEKGDELFTSLLTSTDFDEMIEISNHLIVKAQELIISKQLMLNKKVTEKPVNETLEANLESLKVKYIDFKERLNKVRSACVKNDFYSAAYNATKVQLMAFEIISLFSGKKINYDFNLNNEICEELKFKLPNLAYHVSKKDINGLSSAVDELEKAIENYYKENEVVLLTFESIDKLDNHLSTLIGQVNH